MVKNRNGEKTGNAGGTYVIMKNNKGGRQKEVRSHA